jgi:hypothetical protein
MPNIRPQYRDKKACPYCHSLLERLGSEKADYRLMGSDGRPEWTWAPKQVRGLPPEKIRPEHDGQRWTKHTVRYMADARGVEVERERTEWEFLVDYLCPECNTVFQACDVKEFEGDIPQWAVWTTMEDNPDLQRLQQELKASMEAATERPSEF